MSAGGAFGGNRGVRPVPPEKGVFPLDHMHLCDLEKKEYLGCLKSTGQKNKITNDKGRLSKEKIEKIVSNHRVTYTIDIQGYKLPLSNKTRWLLHLEFFLTMQWSPESAQNLV
ncbi:uncharacterized protein LOC129884931 [Solanum dulcamara]|uniref:uncharacterized protein LOC129884931 n=1 Tax=Solanum dulcamara TaxID=45834 RepID=UPI00248594C5|nr:uncharacterized protein LOC129884931 [Solanum dulcamara]